jgi:hypothetical protein
VLEDESSHLEWDGLRSILKDRERNFFKKSLSSTVVDTQFLNNPEIQRE